MSQPIPPPDARTRAADLYVQHARPLGRLLARDFPNTDPQLIADAAVDAVLDLARNPDRFDPDRGSVRGWLFGAARRVLAKLIRGEQRRRRREREKSNTAVTDSPP